MYHRVILTIASFLLVGVNPAPAHAGCDEAQISRDFGDIGLRSLEILLLPTPYRALCGHQITDDVQFWQSMVSHYNCTKDSELSEFVRHHWGRSIDNRRDEFESFRLKSPEDFKTMCLQAGELHYPEVYSFDGLMDVERQIAERPALLPK